MRRCTIETLRDSAPIDDTDSVKYRQCRSVRHMTEWREGVNHGR